MSCVLAESATGKHIIIIISCLVLYLARLLISLSKPMSMEWTRLLLASIVESSTTLRPWWHKNSNWFFNWSAFAIYFWFSSTITMLECILGCTTIHDLMSPLLIFIWLLNFFNFLHFHFITVSCPTRHVHCSSIITCYTNFLSFLRQSQ